METNIRAKGLVNWLLLSLLTAGSLVVALHAHSASGLAATWFMGVGFLVAAVSCFQMRLAERERLEQMEFDELKKTAASGALFTGPAEDAFPARRAREQFERYLVPGFSVVAMALTGYGCYWLWGQASKDLPAAVSPGRLAMALYGLFALVAFQFGRYSSVLAGLERHVLLRPQASYLLLAAVLSATCAILEIAGQAGYPGADRVVARVLAVMLGLVSVEALLVLVFEAYRPRVKGQADRPLYESRLIGLLSQPGGIITTMAQALDYQFGFKVSETWFYRMLERALAWLVLLQIGLLLLSTCFVFIEPGERGLLERFGRPVAGREVLEAGPHLKLPWPMDEVHRYPTDRIQSFLVGIVHEEKEEEHRTVLWAKAHAKEESNMLVASREQTPTRDTTAEQAVPVNLLVVNLPVQYLVSDVQLFAYKHADAGALLQLLANSEVSRYLVSVDLDQLMGPGRQQAADELRSRIQKRADALALGVRILYVGLQGIHPPVKVAPDFEKVVGALQEKEATNLYARAYAAERVPLARAEAAAKVDTAEAYRHRQMTLAGASATRFTNQLAAFRASPDVYLLRSYLDTQGRALAGARKYLVLGTNTAEVISLNLEDKLRPDLGSLPLPPEKKQPQ